jgi:hypothetical protein
MYGPGNSAPYPRAWSRVPYSYQFKMDAGWVAIGMAAAVSLFLPWPVMAVVGCIALSRYRGPNHYTKFMVPYPYRFKWDAGWIVILIAGAVAGLGVWGGHATGWGIFALCAVVFIALLRVVVWLCFRFPLVSWFFVMLLVFLIGGGMRFGMRWWWF